MTAINLPKAGCCQKPSKHARRPPKDLWRLRRRQIWETVQHCRPPFNKKLTWQLSYSVWQKSAWRHLSGLMRPFFLQETCNLFSSKTSSFAQAQSQSYTGVRLSQSSHQNRIRIVVGLSTNDANLTELREEEDDGGISVIHKHKGTKYWLGVGILWFKGLFSVDQTVKWHVL